MKRLILTMMLALMLCAVLQYAYAGDTMFIYGDYTYSFSGDNVIIRKYGGSETDLTIIDSIPRGSKTYPVIGIGKEAFSENRNLFHVTIPDSITTIGERAFFKCVNLQSVKIGNGVSTIGTEAFYHCISLTDVSFGKNVSTLAYGAFCYCRSLTDMTIPESVTSIGSYAFSSCYGLVSVTIPESVVSIEENAFFACKALQSVTIPRSVTEIKTSTFSQCYGLTSVTIPDSVTSIGYLAFSECTALTSVTIPDSVTSIGKHAFVTCGLKEITIPGSVTALEEGVFQNNPQLVEATISSGVTRIGIDAFRSCTALTDVVIPASVTAIDDRAFWKCSALKNVWYMGTEAEWNAISISEVWNAETPDDMAVICNGDGTEASPWKIGHRYTYSELRSGWYTVIADAFFPGRIHVNGSVHIDLGADTTLTAAQGINVSSGNTLILSGSGTLNAIGCRGCAGIGGGDKESCGTVTINGGFINATGSVWGAGIGGGAGGNGGNITINGGNVTAQCYDLNDEEVGLAAGIGGGDTGSGGTILITGGTVYARGNRGSAGIGGGGYGSGGTITITGGNVTAIGSFYPNGRSGAGIGAGRVRNNATSGDSGNSTITGGTIIAMGGDNAQAIGLSNEVAESDNGTLILGKGLMVFAGDSENTAVVATSNPAAACRSAWAKIVSAPTFCFPDFTLPPAITSVEEEAFEGAGMRVVLIPDTCTSIGARAFGDCQSLTQIRIPEGCTIGADAFDGCTDVYIYGTSGSPAEMYCAEHENCVFVEE